MHIFMEHNDLREQTSEEILFSLQKTDSLKHGHRRPRKTILCTRKFQKK
jgi:hypothetical protein